METLCSSESLRQDHARLCGELAVLKRAEGGQDPSELWRTLRIVCARLSMGLLEHIRREEAFLRSFKRSLGAAALESPLSSAHHYGDYRYLQVITRSIHSETRPFLLNSRYQLMTDYLSGLRRRMDEQEEEIFRKPRSFADAGSRIRPDFAVPASGL